VPPADAGPARHDFLPLPPQGDLEDRAETVEPPTDPAPLERPTAALFQHHAFMRLWFSRLFGTTANQMLLVALGWQMYDLTHSAWDLGLVGLLQFLPALALVLVAGQVVDRLHRARIVAVCMAAQTLVAALLIWASADARGQPRAAAPRLDRRRHGARLPDADAAGADADGAAARAAAARPGVQLGGRAGRDRRRSGDRRLRLCRRRGRRSTPAAPCFSSSPACSSSACATRRRARQEGDLARHAARRRALRPRPAGRARRDLARPVRRAVRRRGRAAADLRPRPAAGRRVGPGPAARRAGGGRARHLDRAHPLAGDAPRRPRAASAVAVYGARRSLRLSTSFALSLSRSSSPAPPT
jgi:hypothetical protein